MMIKYIATITIAFFIGLSSLAQNSINDYKYVIVPQKFEFFKGKDRYRTSTLLRYLFKKEGLEVYFEEEELPQELFQNRCLAMYAKVLKVSSFLTTKVQIQLNDCQGNEIFLTQEGATKIKEYEKAYPTVIKEAFKSIEALNYSYNPNALASQKEVVATTENTTNSKSEAEKAKAEVERLRREVENLKQQKAIVKEKEQGNKDSQSSDKQKEDIKVVETAKNSESSGTKPKMNVLYAQPIDKGYQLVDAAPKVVMIILKTAAPNVFTVKGENAIVYKENDTWFYSKNETKTPLNIKF